MCVRYNWFWLFQIVLVWHFFHMNMDIWVDGQGGVNILVISKMGFDFKNMDPFWVWVQKHYIYLIPIIGGFEKLANSKI